LLAALLAVLTILYIRHILPIVFSQDALQIVYTSPLLIAPIYLTVDLSMTRLTKFFTSLILSFLILYIYLAYVNPKLPASLNLLIVISILSISLALASVVRKDTAMILINSYYLPILVLLTPPIYNSSNSIMDYLLSLVIGVVLGTALVLMNYAIIGVARISSMPKQYSPSTISASISLLTSITILEFINKELTVPVTLPNLNVVSNVVPIYLLGLVEGLVSTMILRISLIGVKTTPNREKAPIIKIVNKGNLVSGEEVELLIETFDSNMRPTKLKIFLELLTPNKKLKKVKLKKFDKNKFIARIKLEESGEYKVIVRGKGGVTYSETKLIVTRKVSRIEDLDPKIWLGRELYGYKVSEVIGSGVSGYVLKGIKGDRQVAIKVMKITDKSSIDDIAKEISNVSSLTLKEDSENYLVGVYEIYFDRNNLKKVILERDFNIYIERPPVIIMEYMEGGTAHELMRNDQFFYSKYWEDIVCNIIKNVANGLLILHREGYVHLDIKPQNIFFNPKLPKSPIELLEGLRSGRIKVKLGDFGSAAREGDKYYFATPHYASGEQIIEAIKILKKLPSTGAKKYMDIYSLGATAFTLLTRSYLNSQELIKAYEDSFSNLNIESVEKAWREFTPNLEKIKHSKLYPLISSMSEKDPLRRSSIERVVQEIRKVC